MANKRSRLAALGVSLLIAAFVAATPHASASDCTGVAGTSEWWMHCSTSSGGDGNDPDHAPAGSITWIWLPACPTALPGSDGVGEVDCQQMHTCPDPALVLLALYSQVAGTSQWNFEGSECRSPADVGLLRRSLTWQDVESAIRRVGVPAADVTAPGYTLVNLETTFSTDPRPYTRTLQIVGYSVDVDLAPTEYTWHWGDGQTSTTDTPGHPYPSTDVTHTYLRHTGPRQPLALSVDVGWHARYRVDGGPWADIPDTITIVGPTTALPVRQASAVLVEDTHP